MAKNITNRLVAKLNNLSELDLTNALGRCGRLVADTAKQKVNSRQIQSSLTYGDIVDNSVTIGTNVEYAPFLEMGTGIYTGTDSQGLYSALMGSGRQTWWVYVKNGNPEFEGSGRQEPYYTFEEAKQRMAILCSQGLDAHITQGLKPQPFLLPALLDNKEKIKEILGAEVIEEAKSK